MTVTGEMIPRATCSSLGSIDQTWQWKVPYGVYMEKPLKKMVDFQLPALMTCISCEKSWPAANMKYGMTGVICCMTGVITPASQPAAILPGHWYHWYHWVPFTLRSSDRGLQYREWHIKTRWFRVIFHSKLLEYQRLTDIIDIPRIQSHHVSPSVSFPPQIGGGCAPQCAPWHHGTMAFRKAKPSPGWMIKRVSSKRLGSNLPTNLENCDQLLQRFPDLLKARVTAGSCGLSGPNVGCTLF